MYSGNSIVFLINTTIIPFLFFGGWKVVILLNIVVSLTCTFLLFTQLFPHDLLSQLIALFCRQNKRYILKRNTILFFAATVLAVLDGYFLSAISLVGRAGINLFYTEYKFLKTWWKGALLVFVVWVFLYFLQAFLNKRLKTSSAKMVQVVALLLALAGLYFSYADFRNSLSHRWLGERFHLGVYLFWLVWMGISVVLLTRKTTSTNLPQQKPF